MASLLDQLKRQPAKLILRTGYQSPKPSEWLAERAGIAAVELPYTVGGSAAAKDLIGLFDDTISKLNGALK